ncbi:hypothetical protein FHG87_019045 [Trinorchestia longiramus]|nr:hypothetical protein FHG87_019045 [Trinorchestia longiramus]
MLFFNRSLPLTKLRFEARTAHVVANMTKKGMKTSKKNRLLITDSDQLGFSSESSSNISNVLKKSKKKSKDSVLMDDSLHRSMNHESTAVIGEKRKLESSDESPKKKKKKKKPTTDLDTSGHSEKMVESSGSYSSSTERTVAKPSKQTELGNNSLSSPLSIKSTKGASSKSKSKSTLKTGDAFGSPKVKSPKKSIAEKISTPEKIKKVIHHEKDAKSSPGKHAVFVNFDESNNQESSESEEEQSENDDDEDAESKTEIKNEESASMFSGAKGDQAGWTEEQTLQLIDIMTVDLQIKPEERSSFRQRIKKISWRDIPAKLDPPRTAEECLQHLDTIFKKVNTIRNLSEMFCAHKVGIQNRSKYYISLPIQRFRAENTEAIKKRGGNFFSTSKQMFDELPEEEKYRRYVFPYQKELAEKNRKNPKKIASTHSALHFYRLRHPDLSSKEAKQRYSELAPKKRLQYIRNSYEEFKLAWRSHDDLEASTDSKLKAPFCHLSKEEWIIFLRSLGMPVMEAKGPKELFFKMNPENSEEIRKSKAYFMNHPEKRKYHALFAEMQQNFKKKFEEWMTGVEDDIVKKPACAYFEEVMSVKTTLPQKSKKTSVSKVTSKVRELEDSFVESGMVGNFPGEPKAPPITAKECFADYMKRTSPGMKPKEINEKYAAVDEDFREKLEALAIKAVNAYKEEIMEFVEELPVVERKIYIGQNRIKFIKMFDGTDIFEEDYPCSEYPPFKKPTKVVAQSKSPATSEMLTLYDFWTPKRSGSQRNFDEGEHSTSTPVGAETHPTPSSASGLTPSDDEGTDDDRESNSDQEESSAAESTSSLHTKTTAARASARSSSDSSDEDETSTENIHHLSSQTPLAKRNSSKVSKDPLSPSKLRSFLHLKQEMQSSGSANGVTKFSPQAKKPAAALGKKLRKQKAASSSDEESVEEEKEDDEDEETDEEYNLKTELTQRKAHRSHSEERSDDESEEELVPAWSQK